MATFFLKARELDQKLLPKVCMVCGNKGRLRKVELEVEVNKFFNQFFRGGKIQQFRRRNAWVPLCSTHEMYFDRGFSWWTLGLVLIPFAIIVSMIIGGGVLGIKNFAFFLTGGCLFATVVVGIVGWQLFGDFGKTRPTRIEDDGIDMANLDDAFMDAVEDARDDRAADRQKRRRARDRDD